MSDLPQVQTADDHELRRFAQTLWASDDYRSWREQALRAVADGSIYDEPPLMEADAFSFATAANLRDLIVDLRASRAEVKRLRAYIAADPMRTCYEEAEAERDALQAEVERLRAENAQLEKWIPSGW